MDFPPPYLGQGETPGPDASLVLWVHHDGESHWMTRRQILNRIRDIRETKPEDEVLPRLTKMTIIPYKATYDKAYSECEAICDKASSEYEAICSKASSEYQDICSKASSEYQATYGKASSEYQDICNKASSEYKATYDKASSEYQATYGKASSEYKAIRSKAYSECEAIRSKAVSELLKIVDMSKAVSGLEYEKTMTLQKEVT